MIGKRAIIMKLGTLKNSLKRNIDYLDAHEFEMINECLDNAMSIVIAGGIEGREK